MDKLNIQVELALMLIKLGVASVDKIKQLFRDDGHDDETLARIMTDVDARIARRS